MSRAPITRKNPYTPKGGAFAGQTFLSERQYRNALARQRGFRSEYERQRTPKPVHSAATAVRLNPVQQETRDRALDALSRMRRNMGLKIGDAAKEAGTTPNAIQRYAGGALTQGPRGRIVAKPYDKLYRPMRFITPNGVISLDIRRSGTASQIGRYWNAVGNYVSSGDDRDLTPFRGKSFTVNGVRYAFTTDLDVLDALAYRGELRFEDIYAYAA